MSTKRNIVTYNGVLTELQALRKGRGLSVEKVKRFGSMPQIATAFRVVASIENSYEIREKLQQFIEAGGTLSPVHREVLTHLLNSYEHPVDLNLLERRLGLVDLPLVSIQYRKGRSIPALENAAFGMLAQQLLKLSKQGH